MTQSGAIVRDLRYVEKLVLFFFSGGGLCIIRIRFDFLIMFVVIVWIMEKNHGYLLLEGTNHFQS